MAPKSSKRADKEFRRNAAQFRDLLLSGREQYAKGRSYDAVKLQQKAIALGQKCLPRFEDNSLVKAHALLELGLAYSAICTDFACGNEWADAKHKMERALHEAMGIFQKRRAEKTLTMYRREECWMTRGDRYSSPVPHTERLGPIDYITCTQMAYGVKTPSVETVRHLKKAIEFGLEYKATKCVVRLEEGGFLQGELQSDAIVNVKKVLKEHELCLAGGEPNPPFNENVKEERHMGTRHGKMKDTAAKLTADVERKGLSPCSYEECQEMEHYARQFSTCSRCKWAAYCCREHQKLDWPRHKKECKTVATERRKEYKEMLHTKDNLMPGQVQQFMTVVRYLHFFLANSTELRYFPLLPSLSGPDDHTSLSMLQIGIIWDCLWAIPPVEREGMLHRFLSEISPGFESENKGGPPFSIVLSWHEHHITGTFAVVEHTPLGSTFLYDDPSSGKIVAYRVVGISDSIKTIMKPIGLPLPLMIRTTLLPFKNQIVTQGTIAQGDCGSSALQTAAAAFKTGSCEMDVVTSLPVGAS